MVIEVQCSGGHSVKPRIREEETTKAIDIALDVFRIKKGENSNDVFCPLCSGRGSGIFSPITVKVDGAQIKIHHSDKSIY